MILCVLEALYRLSTNMEFSMRFEYRLVCIVTLTYLTAVPGVYPQPVIDEDFIYTERCTGSSGTSKERVVDDNIKLIMRELHQQNHENMLLKSEVEELKSKYEEQRVLFSQLNEMMQVLLKKIKLGQASCPCDVKSSQTTKDSTTAQNIRNESPSPSTVQRMSPVTYVTVDQEVSTTSTPITPDMATKNLPPGGDNYRVTSSEIRSLLNQKVPYPRETVNVSSESDHSTGEQLRQEASETSSTSTHSPKTGYIAVHPRDCQDLLSSRNIFEGRYRIQPANSSKSFYAYCQLVNDTAWTVIQRRSNGKVDFFRNWTEYRHGFGEPDGEFWIGNEQIHQLTKQGSYKLRIDMWDWSGNYYYAESSYVYIGNESEYYIFHSPDDYYAYSGFGGSGLRVHRGPFMTFDRQDPSMISDNCAQKFHSGWWFTTCVRNANLNGQYYKDGYENLKTRTRNVNDVYWHNIQESLKRVEMKLLRTEPWGDKNKI